MGLSFSAAHPEASVKGPLCLAAYLDAERIVQTNLAALWLEEVPVQAIIDQAFA